MGKAVRTHSSRKVLGAEDSRTRAALVEAAEQLMREEGYAAVTSRRIAAKAGLKHQVIFYYFETLDDLYLEVFRKGAQSGLARVTEALNSDNPLRAFWELAAEPRGTRFVMEFMALANHNEVIRAEIARFGKEMRKLQAKILTRHLKERGIEPSLSPMIVSVLITALARLLVNEASVGIELGHAEARALVDICLRQFETMGSTIEPLKIVETRA